MILLTLLAIGCSGCHSFTLVGAVNLGAQEQNGIDNQADGNAQQPSTPVCWPRARAAFDEMVSHGFTPKKWPATEKWFTQLEAVKAALPECGE